MADQIQIENEQHYTLASLSLDPISSFRLDKNINIDELINHLEDILIENFELEADDGSVQHTASLLSTLYYDCLVKKEFDGLMSLLNSPKVNVFAREAKEEEMNLHKIQSKEDKEQISIETKEEIHMGADTKDEDGWIKVVKKRRCK